VLRHDPSDLYALADRLRQGIPDRGFDGRPIPIRDEDGSCVSSVDAARILLESALAALDPLDAIAYRAAVLQRASDVETQAITDGVVPRGVEARMTAVLVSAAVRANVLGRGHDISPSGVNRATLAWYDRHRLRSSELIDALDRPFLASRPA
jgi:hypothetical protein